MTARRAIVLMFGAAATFVGGRSPPAAAQTPEPAVAIAVTDVRDAECARAAQCSQIGPGKLYSSRRACKNAVAKREARALNASTCPDGPDQGALSQCLADLARLDCGSVPAGGTALPTCGKEALCGGGPGQVGLDRATP